MLKTYNEIMGLIEGLKTSLCAIQAPICGFEADFKETFDRLISDLDELKALIRRVL